jgi:hypothetical protein
MLSGRSCLTGIFLRVKGVRRVWLTTLLLERWLLHAGYLLSLFFDPEDGGDVFLRNTFKEVHGVISQNSSFTVSVSSSWSSAASYETCCCSQSHLGSGPTYYASITELDKAMQVCYVPTKRRHVTQSTAILHQSPLSVPSCASLAQVRSVKGCMLLRVIAYVIQYWRRRL